MLNDELEPMRRAAELGCRDFDPEGKFAMPYANIGIDDRAIMYVPLPSNSNCVNRYAACRCECWWRQQEIEHVTQRNDVLRMIDLCRAFARKYGV